MHIVEGSLVTFSILYLYNLVCSGYLLAIISQLIILSGSMSCFLSWMVKQLYVNSYAFIDIVSL